MRSYELFSSHDFVADDAFIAWVIRPTEASNSFWHQWVNQHPYKKAEIDEAIKIIKELSSQPNVFSEDEIQENWARINQKISPFTRQESDEIVVPLWRRWYAVAAAVTVLVLFGAGIWWYQQPILYATTYGEKRTIVLPDSSFVTLNGNSQLAYSRGWTTREVSLKGEAFFQVKKQNRLNEPVKFSVKTGRVTVNVVGTIFNVNDRRGKTEIMLKEGKVQLAISTKNPQNMLLIPGEKATLLANSDRLVKEKSDPEIQTAWLRNMLIFNGETLSTIFQQLEDGYGIRTTVTRPDLLKKRFTGSVTTDSINTFYNQLQTIYSIRVKPIKGGYLVE
ncbi:DUF4974 domain-containing protein [Spirosoma sp. HMF4905]|uniref:DUF4974 domain-containing protein n=1 Tax=Spirosoma arboris TaxID=2682092 RepID=A0A7K1SC74_9BACT|nr:FecR domain-containing protein [Spirosoma arboris]MVM31407.1 DUF4974 domain-containing protein [Spirosoma arboris]